GVEREFNHAEDDAPGGSVTVRGEAGGGEPQDDIAGDDAGAVDDLRSFRDPDGEPGQVVLSRRVQIRQLGGLAADECTPRLPAAVRDPGDARLDARGRAAR